MYLLSFCSLFWGCFVVLLSSFALIPYALMVIFRVWFGFLSFLYVFIYHNFCFVVIMRFIYSNIYMCTWLSCLSFKFKCTLFLFLGCTHSMQKVPGQRSNPCHSSDNTGSLSGWATRELIKSILTTLHFSSPCLLILTYFTSVFVCVHLLTTCCGYG